MRRSLAAAARYWPPAILVLLLFLMYSSAFTSDYLMNDDWDLIGLRRRPLSAATRHFLTLGRVWEGLLRAIVYNFAGYSTLRMQVVRFANFVSMAALAVWVFRLLARSHSKPLFPLLLTLFLWSQPAAQGVIGYSLHLCNVQAALLVSVLAFHLHFFVFTGLERWRWLERLALLLLFLTALQSAQSHTYFAMVLVVHVALTDWPRVKPRVGEFFAIGAIALAIELVLLLIGLDRLHQVGELGYLRAEASLAALADDPIAVLVGAFNPLRYWSAFAVWSYPFPIHDWLPSAGQKRALALAVMAAWTALMGAAVFVERSRTAPEARRDLAIKWTTVFTCLVFGATWLVADSPPEVIEHRPHVTAVLNGGVLVSGAYAARVLAATLSARARRWLRSAAFVLVAFGAAGAQAGLSRAIVGIRVAQLDFLRAELVGKPVYRRVVIVVPRGEPICLLPPCGMWWIGPMQTEWDLTRTRGYRYALATLGVEPDRITFKFVQERPATLEADEVLVDWTRFVAARLALQNPIR